MRDHGDQVSGRRLNAIDAPRETFLTGNQRLDDCVAGAPRPAGDLERGLVQRRSVGLRPGPNGTRVLHRQHTPRQHLLLRP